MVDTSSRVDPSVPLPPNSDPRGRHRSRRLRSGFARVVGRTAGAIVSIALLLLSGYVWLTYRSINSGVHRLPVAVNAPPKGKHDIDGTDQNILIVGNDDRSNMTNAEVRLLKVGRDGGSMATDTMMIVHLPANGAKATLISLPRDSYVDIPGYGMNKLNSAYVDGYNHASGTPDQRRTAGADSLIKTATDLTGLTINHYIQVSLLGFYELSNAIGGVPVTMCESVRDVAEAGHGSGLVISKGKHSIQGVQALEFVRQRYNFPNGLGDLDRVKRQQYFLAAAFRKVASVGVIFKLQALGDAIKRNIYTDPGLNLLDLAHQMEKLSADNIVGRTIPFQRFADVNIAGVTQSVEIVVPRQVQAFLGRLLRPSSSTKGPSSAASSGASASTSKSANGSKAIDVKCIY